MKSRYIHKENVHNLKDPKEIVPVLMQLFNPKSVVDIGCGLGTFLHVFKQHGVQEVLGLDGPWTDKELLSQYLEKGEFMECQLEEEIQLDQNYDLVISLEVAEHLSPQAADIFIKNLISAGKVIVFSAAIPEQGGQNHLNEQWNDYWIKKFESHGYVIHDIFKPLFWDNPNIFWWYKQNMLLFTPKDATLALDLKINTLKNAIHPELFKLKAQGVNDLMERINHISKGKLPPSTYAKLWLRSVLGQNRMEWLKKRVGR